MNYFGAELHTQLVNTRRHLQMDIAEAKRELEDLNAEVDRLQRKLYANEQRLKHLVALIGPDEEEPPL